MQTLMERSVRVTVYGSGLIGTLIAGNVIKKEGSAAGSSLRNRRIKNRKGYGRDPWYHDKTEVVLSYEFDTMGVLKSNEMGIVLHSTSSYLDRISTDSQLHRW